MKKMSAIFLINGLFIFQVVNGLSLLNLLNWVLEDNQHRTAIEPFVIRAAPSDFSRIIESLFGLRRFPKKLRPMVEIGPGSFKTTGPGELRESFGKKLKYILTLNETMLEELSSLN